MTTLELQRRLAASGFDPGPLDGAWGPRTRRALVALQSARGLAADGVPGPRTLAALTVDWAAPDAAPEPLWLTEARRRMGLREQADNTALRAFLKADGRTLGDPARLPWCGDFVETCIRLALPDEPVPANPYLARNWLAFGIALASPALGAVAVFWRGSRTGSSGHVGFVAGADAKQFAILGGNQANAVSISRIARSRLLGLRWPETAGASALAAMPKATGVVTTNEA